MSVAKRRALDTLNGGNALQSDDTGLRTNHQDPIVSFDSAANIQKELETLADRYDNISKEHTFIGDLSKTLGLRNNGNHSNYGTFEAKNVSVVRIRISDHNAEVKNFKKEMQNGKILHLSDKLSLDSDGCLTEAPNGPEGPDLVPTSDKVSYDGKVNALSTDKQISDDESPSRVSNDKGAKLERLSVQASVQAALAEVNTEPTPAQAERPCRII